MIECSFEYNFNLLQKINNNTLKKYNIINEILIGLIFIAIAVMFVVGNIILGIILSITSACLIASLIFTNISIKKSNNILLGQRVKVVFKEDDMNMTGLLGDKVLYKTTIEYSVIKKVVEKSEFVYVYLDKKSIIVIPKASFKTTQDYKKAIELAGNNYVV